MYKNNIKFLLLILCISTSSCEKWLTVQPAEMLTKKEMFTTASGFHDALMGTYVLMQKQYHSKGDMTSGYIEHFACQWEVASQGDERKANEHKYKELETTLDGLYKAHYKTIANLNLLLENIETQDRILSDTLYNSYKGQALALRAYTYLDLIRLWGPIPNNVSDSRKYIPYVTNMSIAFNTPITYSEYMKKLLMDLDAAEECFSKVNKELIEDKEYNSALFNLYSVYALKARYYTWIGGTEGKEKAVHYANLLIEMEKIWKLARINEIEAGDLLFKTELIASLSYYVTSDNNGNAEYYHFSEYLDNELFKENNADIRLGQWKKIDKLSNDDRERKAMSKYIFEKPDGKTKSYIPLLRLAEMYLIAIENSPLQEANRLANKFCVARNTRAVNFEYEEAKMEWLRQQYQLEFISEGQLFYAYKRFEVVEMPRCPNNPCGPDVYVIPVPSKEGDLNN